MDKKRRHFVSIAPNWGKLTQGDGRQMSPNLLSISKLDKKAQFGFEAPDWSSACPMYGVLWHQIILKEKA
jgi:hypothetical protein